MKGDTLFWLRVKKKKKKKKKMMMMMMMGRFATWSIGLIVSMIGPLEGKIASFPTKKMFHGI